MIGRPTTSSLAGLFRILAISLGWVRLDAEGRTRRSLTLRALFGLLRLGHLLNVTNLFYSITNGDAPF